MFSFKYRIVSTHTVDQANYNFITQSALFFFAAHPPVTPPSTPKMPPRRNLPNRGEDAFVLVWTDAMIDTFPRLLEEAHDNGKQSNTGFKPEAWIGFKAGVQVE